MTVWRTRIEYWIIKATNTDSEYVICTYYSSTETMGLRIRHNVTSYLHCLTCFNYSSK